MNLSDFHLLTKKHMLNDHCKTKQMFELGYAGMNRFVQVQFYSNIFEEKEAK